jgi:CHAT domain-containing protein
LNLGFYYDSLGDNDNAIDYYLKALPLKRALVDKSGESRCLTNLGEAYRCRGDKGIYAQKKEQAQQDFQASIMNNLTALTIAKQINDIDLIAKSSGNLANTYACMDNSISSIEWNIQALELAKSIGEKQTILACYSNLSNEYNKLGDEQKSLEYAELALSLESSDISSKEILYFNLAKLYSKSNPLRSFEYCLQSLEVSKKISANLVEEHLKINYVSEMSKIYDILIPVCLKLSRFEAALKYAEESKSRSQHELMAATEIIPKIEMTNEIEQLLSDEKKCLDRLQQIQMRYLETTAVEVEPDEAFKISNKLSSIYERLERFIPQYVSLRRAEPLTLDGIKQLLSSLGKNVVLIEYYLTNDNLIIFTISTSDYELHVKPIVISSDELFKYIEYFDEEVVRFRVTGKTSDRWLELSKFLIEPIAQFIPPSSTIYFVPHRVLHYIPLHALELNGEPLIVNHPVAYSSSASILNLCLHKGTDKRQTCAAYGIKPFDIEAKKIAEFFNTKPYLNEDATCKAVLENQNKDIIHLSCHGEFDLDHPHKSGIMLFDGPLTVKDLIKMHLKTELVTLSACSTGLSKYTHGNEMVGLIRAVLYAGAPSVIVSLWPVYGPSTELLMHEFYAQFTGQNDNQKCYDKVVSMQQAQIKLMEKYPHPFYWAPFILIGKL